VLYVQKCWWVSIRSADLVPDESALRAEPLTHDISRLLPNTPERQKLRRFRDPVSTPPSTNVAPNGQALIPHILGPQPTCPGGAPADHTLRVLRSFHERPSADPGDRVSRCLHLTRFLRPSPGQE
jgi:hypothetical protein